MYVRDLGSSIKISNVLPRTWTNTALGPYIVSRNTLLKRLDDDAYHPVLNEDKKGE